MNFEFMDFVPTPGEKHLGIARVKFYGKIVLRYKIVAKKDGLGYFPTVASYKMPTPDGSDSYASAFTIESNSDKEDVEQLIRVNCRRYLEPSALAQPAPQPVPNYNYNLQQNQAPFIQRPEYQQPSFPDMPPAFDTNPVPF